MSDTIEIADKSDFRFWALQKPNARKLLHEVIFRWRNTSARIPGEPGKWCVHPIAQWCQWSGLSSDQAERALKELEAQGFVKRKRRRFQGKAFRAFLQPTARGLEYAGRPEDAKRLGTGNPAAAGIDAGTAAGMAAAMAAGIAAATYTPSLPSSKKLLSTIPPSDEVGSAGDDLMKEEEDEFEKQFKAKKAKDLNKLLAKYPIMKGPHQAKVRHPSQLHEKWSSWSEKLRTEKYALYLMYVQNFYKGKNAKGLCPALPQPLTEEAPATPGVVTKAPVIADMPSAQFHAAWKAETEDEYKPKTLDELNAILGDL